VSLIASSLTLLTSLLHTQKHTHTECRNRTKIWYHVFPDDSYFVSVWLSKNMVLKPVIVLREHFGGDCISLLFSFFFSLSLSLLPLSESGVYDHRSACYKGTARFAVAPAVERSNEVKLWEQKGFVFYLFIYFSVS